MKKNFVIIAAHPDDEAFGCAGTVAKLIKNNWKAHLLFFTDGVSARKNHKNLKNKIKRRKFSALRSSKLLGITNVKFLSFPDNGLDKVKLIEIIKEIESYIEQFKPEIIFTHSNADLNIDHEIINRAVITATRPKPNYCVKKILLFETLSSTEWIFSGKKNNFEPNYFVDIKDTIKLKIRAIKAYKAELRRWPHPRSVNGAKILANYRGQSVGFEFAEAFFLLRENS